MSELKQFKKNVILHCRKHKPKNVTVKEYIKMYITGAYPLIQGVNYWDSLTENSGIIEDFGIGMNALINRLTDIYNRIYVKPEVTTVVIHKPQLTLF